MPTNVIQVYVYEIDGIPCTPQYQLFPAESEVLPYYGSNQALYAVIVGDADNRHYAVVQTTAQLLTLMNT